MKYDGQSRNLKSLETQESRKSQSKKRLSITNDDKKPSANEK